MCKAEGWDNGFFLFTLYAGKLLHSAHHWGDISPHFKPKKEVTKPLRTPPRRRRKNQSLLDGLKQSLEVSTAWLDA